MFEGDVGELLKHPSFLGLPPEEQRKYVGALIPNFSGLPVEEQDKYLGLVIKGTSQPTTPSLSLPQPTKMGPVNIIGNLGDTTSESLGMFQPENIPENIPSPTGIPGQVGRGMVEQLPIAGMVLGSAAGTALGGPLGPLAGPAGGILGAGIGGQVRGALKGYMGLGETPPLLEAQTGVGKEMIGAGVAEAGGPLLGKIAQKITSPYAAGLEKKMAAEPATKLGQKLVDQGIPISPDVIYPTRIGKAADYLISNVWPANSIAASQRRQIFNLATKLNEEFVTEYGAFATNKNLVDNLYNNFVIEAGGPEAIIALPKTMEYMAKSLGKPFAQNASGKTGSFWLKDAPTLYREHLSTGTNTVQGIRDMLATIKPKSVTGADSTARNNLIKYLKEDLTDFDTTMGTNLADNLAAASNISWLKKRVAPVEQLLRDSVDKKASQGLGELSLFDPIKFNKYYAEKRPLWIEDSRFGPKDIAMLDAFNEKMKALSPDVLKLAKHEKIAPPAFSPWGVMQATIRTPAGAVLAGYVHPYIVIPAVGTTLAMATSFMSPSGMLRKFLTTGFAPPTMASKMGIMAGMEEALKNAEPNQ